MNPILPLLLSLALALPAPAQTPAADATLSVAAREGRRNLAFNLASVEDWTTQAPFIDVMRTARQWIGHLPGQWGGRDADWLRAAGALDDAGWVLNVPHGLSHVTALVLTDLPAEMQSVAGRYHATWQGDAPVGFGGRARNVRYHGRNAASFDFQPGPGSVQIEFRRGSLREMTLVHERHRERFAAGEIFNPDWLARIGDAELLRFMNWMGTNNSPQREWADRAQLSDATWTRRGVPLEVILELANQTGAEPWFTLPHLASDDYIRLFGETVRDRLRPDLRAWVEFSNEVWNWGFQQAHWAEERARERWGRDWAWVQFYALRASEAMDILSEVFADRPERLVRVLGVFTGWLGLEEDILNAPLWRAEDPAIRPPHERFDAYAVTGYFSAELHEDARQDLLRGWLAESRALAETEGRALGLEGAAFDAFVAAHRFDHAVALAGRELLDGSVSGQSPPHTVRHLLDHTLAHHAAVARRHGLALVMYEGGTHVVVSPARHGETEIVEFFARLNHSHEMGDLYRELIAGWAALSDAPFNAYYDIGRPSVWGSWGALRHLDDDNPRWRALIEATAP